MRERLAMFYSVIAFGVAFIASLVAAGIALDKPSVVKLAVLVAGGSYLTQTLASIGHLVPSLVLWGVTILIALSAVALVVF